MVGLVLFTFCFASLKCRGGEELLESEKMEMVEIAEENELGMYLLGLGSEVIGSR